MGFEFGVLWVIVVGIEHFVCLVLLLACLNSWVVYLFNLLLVCVFSFAFITITFGACFRFVGLFVMLVVLFAFGVL